MMWLSWSTIVFCISVWRTTCEAVILQEVHNTTSSSGSFCVTVSDEEPPGLSSAERQSWKSSPAVSLKLIVEVTRLKVYVTCASKQKLEQELLTLGSHFVEYQWINATDKTMKIAVSVNGKDLDPQNCSETIYSSTSQFGQIKVSAKGPLSFSWNEACPETTRAPSTKAITTVAYQSTKLSVPLPSSRSTRDASTIISNTIMLTSITPNILSVSSTPSSGAITDNLINGDGDEGSLPFWTWILAGAGLVVVILVAVCSCYACSRSRKQKGQMKRITDAERVKQELLVDAKRLSHQEQLRWDIGRVDTEAVPASQEFSYNMTTFTDQT